MAFLKRIERVQPWLDACLPGRGAVCIDIECVRDRPEREVWICRLAGDAAPSAVVLGVFKPGSLETVNTSLPPGQAVAKCALAMRELPALGIPTPRVLGHAVIGEQAAVLC